VQPSRTGYALPAGLPPSNNHVRCVRNADVETKPKFSQSVSPRFGPSGAGLSSQSRHRWPMCNIGTTSKLNKFFLQTFQFGAELCDRFFEQRNPLDQLVIRRLTWSVVA